ncbi:MAG: RNA-guided endonuclease InsQ/TnpB family protein [Acidimicrobiales bacterium]
MSSTNVARYCYRLRVSPVMERKLLAEWDHARWVWNRCVEESKKAHAANLANHGTPEQKVTCGPAQLGKMLTSWRADNEWLSAGSSVVQQQMVRGFGKARAKALADRKAKLPVRQRRGLPKFKSRHRALASLQYTRNGFSLKADAGTGRVRLHLAGGIVLRPVWSRELASVPSSVNVYRDAVGDWWSSFVVQVEHEKLAPTGRVIGVDWGVSVIATTTTDAFDLDHRQRGKSAAGKLARYQKMMARRRPAKGQPASNGYTKAKRRAVKLHRQIARQRQDDARTWAKAVVTEFDQLAVEDFRPKFLARSTMAKKAADGAIGTTKRELVAMATKHGRDLRLVDPSYTTMDCFECGARAKHRLPLSERTYTCEHCGVVKPRDKNSAAVMVARAGFDPAGVDGGRPAPPLESQAA